MVSVVPNRAYASSRLLLFFSRETLDVPFFRFDKTYICNTEGLFLGFRAAARLLPTFLTTNLGHLSDGAGSSGNHNSVLRSKQ